MLVCFSCRANNRTANYSALCRYCIETCHWPPNMCNLKPPPVHQISGFETKHRNICGHSLPPPQAPSVCLTALFLSHLHDLPSPPVLCSPSVWLWSSSFFLLLAETTQDNPRNESQSNITQHNMVMESYLNIKNIKKKTPPELTRLKRGLLGERLLFLWSLRLERRPDHWMDNTSGFTGPCLESKQASKYPKPHIFQHTFLLSLCFS